MFILFLSLILSQRGSGKQGWHGSDGWQSTVIKVIVSKLGYVPWYDVFLFKGYALHKNKVLTLQQHLSDESREIKFSKEIFQCWVWRWSVIPPQYQWLTTISNQIVGEIIYSNHKQLLGKARDTNFNFRKCSQLLNVQLLLIKATMNDSHKGIPTVNQINLIWQIIIYVHKMAAKCSTHT